MTGSNTSENTKQIPASNADLETGYSSRDSTGLPSAYSLARVLDEMDIAAISTDINARVLHMNRGAKDIVGTGAGLKVTRGVLKTGTDLDTIRLRQLIKKAAINAENSAKQRRHFGMALGENGNAEPQSIIIAGLNSKGPDKRAEEVRAILFVAQRERRNGVPDEILRMLFGLTSSEAILAAQVVEGKGLGPAAKKSSVGINTVRALRKNICGKTGTGRQAELVRVLVRSVGFVRVD